MPDTDLQVAWKAFYEAWMNGLEAVRKQARNSERQRIREWLRTDEPAEVAGKASDCWFGRDGDLKVKSSELAKAQARVELAAVADLLDADD